ncbi:MAG: hybrid sensor histidine kinase/response regulator transcription factor [Bacteroidota bacterium]
MITLLSCIMDLFAGILEDDRRSLGFQVETNKDSEKSQSSIVQLNQLKLFNKEVKEHDHTGILKTALSKTETLVLRHDQNFFSIKFSRSSTKNRPHELFSYMLEGFDKDWVLAEGRKEAIFTNVPPGNYNFRVRAVNQEVARSEEEAHLRVVIQPPWWRSPLAYLTYFVLAAVMIILMRKVVLMKMERRNQAQLDEMKARLFTHLSHELKTPLALILGPLNELLSNRGNQHSRSQLLALMKRNAQGLLRLINQLMDIYQVDAGFSVLKVSSEPVGVLTTNVFNNFRREAKRKQLHYHLYAELEEGLLGYVDKDKLSKILNNLIANAINFTPENGAVMVFSETVTRTQDPILARKVEPYGHRDALFLKVRVEDSGFGIPPDLQKKVFNRFFQAKSYEINETGAGIGLSLAHQLISVHKGFMHMESEYMEGCRFTVWIPLDEEVYHPSQEATPVIRESLSLSINSKNEAKAACENHAHTSTSKPLLLLIDSSEDIRKYIRYALDTCFSIKEAANGKEGIDQAKEWIPDIILSDVMMPEINGIELCRQLKNDERTSHIPIILLTAKASEDYHLEGLVKGADDYITKPFNVDILAAKLKNTVKRQELFKKKFQMEFPISQKEMTNRKDEAFLSKCYQALAQNFSEATFGPDQMAKEMGMSRSVLYRKVSGLTGESVSILIRNYRLNRATRLLTSCSMPIKELSFKVGFSDPSYFTSCFKKVYGVAPKEFTARALEDAM